LNCCNWEAGSLLETKISILWSDVIGYSSTSKYEWEKYKRGFLFTMHRYVCLESIESLLEALGIVEIKDFLTIQLNSSSIKILPFSKKQILLVKMDFCIKTSTYKPNRI
jgi:hypothetical protein